MDITLQEWESEYGISFLKKVGIEKSFVVLDFGARVGHYTLPAAKLIAPQGKVYALDKNHDSLETLKDKAEKSSLTNIKIVKTEGELQLEFSDNFFDAILFYDVIHFFELSQMRYLFSQAYKKLKADSLLSIFPRHIEKEMFPLKKLFSELESLHFKFSEKICDNITHDDYKVYDCVYNFIAKKN